MVADPISSFLLGMACKIIDDSAPLFKQIEEELVERIDNVKELRRLLIEAEEMK